MVSSSTLVLCLAQLAVIAAVKVKVVMHSEQDDSRPEDEERPDTWDRRKRPDSATLLPFVRARAAATTSEPATAAPPHPNELLFPLIYRQSHINSMFKFGGNWYTWSADRRADGSRALNYYICYDEPKRCDDVGWERTDSVPKCAFEINSVLADDRACINAFGIEPHTTAAGASPAALCDGADQMKVSDIVRSCGARIRSLWRFVRVGRRSPAAAKPADVNSLLCEDEEECFLTLEYRIHHDRITFSLHEPARGQTFKSVLKRERAEETTETRHEGHRARAAVAATRRRAEETVRRGHDDETAVRHGHDDETAVRRRHDDETAVRRGRDDETAVRRGRDEENTPRKFRVRVKSKPALAEGKGVLKERNDSAYGGRRNKNKIKIRDDVSDDFSSDN